MPLFCSNTAQVCPVHLKKDCHLLLHLSLGPGISGYAKKLSEIDTYLTACMVRATQVVPKSRHQETPVYLGATAGMRLLRYYSTWGHTVGG